MPIVAQSNLEVTKQKFHNESIQPDDEMGTKTVVPYEASFWLTVRKKVHD